MAISSTLTGQGFNSAGFAQIQQQQAQRNADQAEQQARALQAKAQSARAVAGRAQETARSLAAQASQAQGDASGARQSLSALKSLGEVQAQLGGVREQISAVLNPEVATDSGSVENSASTASSPVINVFGETTGTLVNVTA
jgi:type II secretory pathway pseudopilin PulG